MALDPRRILQEAAAARASCELLPRGGSWLKGAVLRVEPGGVVCTVAGRSFVGGEDLRVWLSFDGRTYTFEASVLRAGVPVPDRGQDGLLLGFLTAFEEGDPRASADGRTIALLPPNGPPISLLSAPVRLVDLDGSGLSFTVPANFKLVFVESGDFLLRLGAPGSPPMEIAARVRDLVRATDYLLYRISFVGVDDADAFRQLLSDLSAE